MRIHRHGDPAAFLQAAEGFLTSRAAYHNLPLSVAQTCREEPDRYPGPLYFATAHEGERVVGAAMMTCPHRLQCFVPPGAASAALLEDLARTGLPVAGVHGPRETAQAFAEAWCARHGGAVVLDKHLRGFALERVVPAPPTRGRMRAAGEADIPFVAAGYERFTREAGAQTGGMPAATLGERAVRQGRAFVWEDGEAVAQAVTAPATSAGARIGAVYTPPARRRAGYATALVGALSQHVLDAGRSWCVLYTDLANPISNSIYPKVGYEPIGDFVDLDFA